MPDEKLKLDEALIKILDAGISMGMRHVPDAVPQQTRNLIEATVAQALVWVLRQIEPSAINVKVGKKATAKAEIKWGDGDAEG